VPAKFWAVLFLREFLLWMDPGSQEGTRRQRQVGRSHQYKLRPLHLVRVDALRGERSMGGRSACRVPAAEPFLSTLVAYQDQVLLAVVVVMIGYRAACFSPAWLRSSRIRSLLEATGASPNWNSKRTGVVQGRAADGQLLHVLAV